MPKIEFTKHVVKTDELIPLAMSLIEDVFETYTAKRDRCNKLFEHLLKAANDVPIGEKSNITKMHIDRLFDWLNAPSPTLGCLKNAQDGINDTHDKYYATDEQDRDPLEYASWIADQYHQVVDLYFKYMSYDTKFTSLLEKYDGLLKGDPLFPVPLPAI